MDLTTTLNATIVSYSDKTKFRKLKHLTDDDIASQALVFFLAGFDTISTALCFGSYELAINPEVQSKLRDEILRTRSANNGQLTYESLLGMKYMDKVFSGKLNWVLQHLL